MAHCIKHNLKEKYDWKKMIGLNIFILRMLGMWPKADEMSRFNFYTLYSAVCVFCFMCAHIFFQTMNFIMGAINLEAFTETICMTSSQFLVCFKVCYFIRSNRNLRNLLMKLNSELFQPKNYQQQTIIENCTKYWRIMYYAFWICAISSLSSFSFLPVLKKTVQDYELPFDAWYPYNINSLLVYEFTYVHQIISVWIIGIACINLDTLIAALMVYTAAQCDILCDNLRNLHFIPLKPDSYNIKLLECINHHKEILSFAEKSNEFISFLILIQLFVSAVAIALTLFQLSVIDPLSSDMYFLMSYVISVITQIFIYCWFGNTVETKSEQIPYSIFESEWTSISPTVKKNLIFFAMKAQKPIKISALNLFSLSLVTFATILRTSWSYFAVLQSLQ